MSIGFIELEKEYPQYLTKKFEFSAVDNMDLFKSILETYKPKKIIEIGTYMGISTVVMASVADKVFTFDISEVQESKEIWRRFGLIDKIEPFIGTQKEIDEKISLIDDADFAFIDGDNGYNHVKHDFELVKKTGKVLFHDRNVVGVKKFLKEINTSLIGRDFAIWLDFLQKLKKQL